MDGLRTKAEDNGTSIKPATRDSYDTGNSGAWKYGMTDLMLAPKEAEINAEAILVYM